MCIGVPGQIRTITAASDADRTRLRTGDQVILSAAELYDGKVVGYG